MDYNRYKNFINGFSYNKIPFIEIPKSSNDKYTYYEVGKTRLDLLSYQYYGDANFGWLILQANPQCGSLEFKIKDKERLRIPYPLESALMGYEERYKRYVKLYGLN